MIVAVAPAVVDAGDPSPDSARFFESHIRPILATRCVKCHGPKKHEANLRLDSRDGMLAGGDSGAAIIPGDAGASLLLEAVRYESFEMPPDGELAPREVEEIERWIEAGAHWPTSAEVVRATDQAIDSEDRQWWAFQPLSRPQIPSIERDDWSRNAIDRFVYRRLLDEKMRPARRADDRTLVRRLYYDVLGLPPSPQQIDEALRTMSASGWSALVDRLLADPRYGEHWGRFWLDLVRYAESDGWNKDSYRPQIFRYRDYVIDSFNDDTSYPQFVQQQLAGDQMWSDDPEARVATGFLRLGIYEYNQRDARSHWNDIMNEVTDVTGDVFLGMSMACCRCHDHKFDPLLQNDYYGLRAFFEPLVWRDDLPAATSAEQQAWQRQHAAWEEATAPIRAQLDELLAPYHERKWKSTVEKFPLDIQACFHKPVAERNSWEHQMAYLVERQYLEEGGGPYGSMSDEDKKRRDALKKELAAYDHLKPPPLPEAMTVTDFEGSVAPTVVAGDEDGTPVPPHVPTVFSDDTQGQSSSAVDEADHADRRAALAEWIGHVDNHLTMRVIVNRVWQQHFGRGIVRSASDFGHLGDEPTHPELLDWLTSEFIRGGCRLKSLHRLILTSATWCQSARHPSAAEYAQRDPEEDLMWRFEIRRLKAEQIRDAMLVASGDLTAEIGGPSVGNDAPRRGLYVKRLRNSPDEFLHAFDAANGLTSVSERNMTTTPLQSLLLINGDYTMQRANRLADRLRRDGGSDVALQARLAAQYVWGRDPTTDELEAAVAYIAPAGRDVPEGVESRLVDFCHVLLNSNEFLYVD